jgi:hypothetical protein
MAGNGWQLIDAAPRHRATPTLLAPRAAQTQGADRARESAGSRARTRVRRIAAFVPSLRSIGSPPVGERRAAGAQTPPRWPVG